MPQTERKKSATRPIIQRLECRALLSAAAPVVAQLNIGSLSAQQPQQFATLGNQTLFTTFDPQRGQILWSTDGTPGGTHEIAAMDTAGNPNNWVSYSASYPDNALVIGNTYYFTGLDQAHGRELWKSNGTAAGTQLVADLNPGSGDSNPQGFVDMNGILYFGANGELWRSDGTAAGTTAIFDQTPFDSAGQEDIAVLGNELFFTSYVNGQNTGDLWVSNGTAAGTTLLTTFNVTSAAPDPMDLTTFNGAVYFAANNGTDGYQLWKTDGTVAGTQELTDVANNGGNPYYAGIYPADLQVVGGNLFFQASNSPSGLWVSNGTAAGTTPAAGTQIGTILAINSNGSYFQQIDLGNPVFIGSTEYDQYELNLVSPTGSQQTLATFPDSFGIESGATLDSGGTLYFVITDANGSQLWQSDGTPTGTVPLNGIAPTISDPDPRPLAMVGQSLLVSPEVTNPSAPDPSRELWTVDFATTTTPVSPPPTTPGKPQLATHGHAANDTIFTDANLPMFTGSAPDGATVALLVDGNPVGAATVTDGHYHVAPASKLADGAHSIAVTVTAGGQTSDVSTPLNLTIEKTAPTARLLGIVDDTIVWRYTQQVVHGAAHTAIKILVKTAHGDEEITAHGRLTYDPATQTASFKLPSGLPPGVYRLKLVTGLLTDLAGNHLSGKNVFAFKIGRE
jgi:ELWxxDGT repeat protein